MKIQVTIIALAVALASSKAQGGGTNTPKADVNVEIGAIAKIMGSSEATRQREIRNFCLNTTSCAFSEQSGTVTVIDENSGSIFSLYRASTALQEKATNWLKAWGPVRQSRSLEVATGGKNVLFDRICFLERTGELDVFVLKSRDENSYYRYALGIDQGGELHRDLWKMSPSELSRSRKADSWPKSWN